MVVAFSDMGQRALELGPVGLLELNALWAPNDTQARGDLAARAVLRVASAESLPFKPAFSVGHRFYKPPLTNQMAKLRVWRMGPLRQFVASSSRQ